jgi:tRNA G26 N,N-dimethylase Trm1
MRYRQSLEIHDRLEAVLELIETGRYSTPALAKAVGVSVPSISRIVAALRERGHDIQAQRTSKGWRYVLARTDPSSGTRPSSSGSRTDHAPSAPL